MTRLAASGIVVRLNGRRILDGVDVDLRTGELVGLIGPNGSGKTTSLRVLLNLQAAQAGAVLLDECPVQALSRREFARRVAYMPQGGEVFWPLTVERVVALGRLPHRLPWAGVGAADREAIERAMSEADVTHLQGRTITTLSGGERMLVHLARVIAGQAEMILADEPTAALDPFHQLQVMEQLLKTARRGGAVLVVLHDLTLAARYCDRLILLDGGRVVAAGPPYEILSDRNLADTYRVHALRGGAGAQRFVLPWRMIGSRDD